MSIFFLKAELENTGLFARAGPDWLTRESSKRRHVGSWLMGKPRTSQSGIKTDCPQYAATTQGDFDRVVSLHPESMQVVGAWSQLQGLEAPGYPNFTEVDAAPR